MKEYRIMIYQKILLFITFLILISLRAEAKAPLITQPPEAAHPMPDTTLDEDFGKVFIRQMNEVFSDADSPILTYKDTSLSAGVQTMISNDSLYILSEFNFFGNVYVQVTASDSDSSVTDIMLVTVISVNDQPVILQELQDTVFQQDFGKVFIAKMQDHFFDSDDLLLTYTDSNISFGVTPEISNDSLYLNSEQYFYGVVDITVEASDGFASISDSFAVTVTNINDAPIPRHWINNTMISEDAQNVYAGDVSINFTEADNDPMSYEANSSDSTKLKVHLSNDSLYLSAANDSSGILWIYLKATDPFMAVGIDSFEVTINPVNDRPKIISALRDTVLVKNFGRVFIRKLTTVFSDVDNTTLTYSAVNTSNGVYPSISNDSLYVNSTPNFFGNVSLRVIADDGVLTVSDTFRVIVNDNIPPQVFVNALSSPVLNIVRFVCGANEDLDTLMLTANSLPVLMTKQGNVYFGDYALTSTGSLLVNASATDLAGNQDTLNRNYAVSLLNKPTLFGKFHFTSSAEGYLLLSVSNSEFVPSNWKQYGEVIDVIMTGTEADLKIEAAYERSFPMDEESKIGLYEFINGQWSYVGGEGRNGRVTVQVKKNGKYSAFYNPDRIVVPREFVLGQNYPNPFNPSTKIRYEIPAESHVTIKIYNVLGQEVKTLVHALKSSGQYEVTWDGKNETGKPVASGVYLYRLQSTKFVQTRKMLLVK